MAARLHNGQPIVAPVTVSRLSRLVAGVVVALLLVPPATRAQSASGPEVKAAFLLNFAKFVAWPASELPEKHPIVIGVIGNGAVADALTALVAGKAVDGHAIVVKRSKIDDISGLHLVFIGEAERGRVPEMLKRAAGGSVLTVSDAPRFCSLGGMIQLRLEDDRIRFDINLARAQAAALEVNSKLLALAGSVNPSPRTETP